MFKSSHFFLLAPGHSDLSHLSRVAIERQRQRRSGRGLAMRRAMADSLGFA